MMITRIQQRCGHDCGVASLAMATGLPYEKVLEPFAWRIDEGEGLNEFQFNDWFVRHGWAWQQVYKVHHLGGINQPKDVWPPKPWAPVHLIEARVSAGYHFAVMDDKGRVFDPWDANRKTLDDPAYQDVIWVMGLWRVGTPS